MASKQNSQNDIIQPTLVYAKDGALILLARSRNIEAICKATSQDQGKTWSSAEPTSLPNPDASIQAINLKNGNILLIFNDSKHRRNNLSLALSADN